MVFLKKILKAILNLGVRSDLSSQKNKRLVISNFVSLSGVIATLSYSQILFLYNPGFKYLANIALICGLIYLIPLILNGIGKIRISRYFLLNYSLLMVFGFIYLLGREAGIELFYPTLICYVFLMFSFDEKKDLIFSSSVIVIHIAIYLFWIISSHGAGYIQITAELARILAAAFFPLACGIVYLYVYYFSRTNYIAENKLAEKNNAMHSILENISEGIFTMDQDLKVLPRYSRHLESIFPGKDFAGKDALLLLFGYADYDKENLSLIKESLQTILGNNILNFKFNRHNFPEKLNIMVDGVEKKLSLGWDPVADAQHNVVKMLVIVRDVTGVVKKEEDEKRATVELKMTEQILNLDQGIYHRLMESTLNQFSLCQAFLRGWKISETEKYDKVLQVLHSIKGNMRACHFTLVSSLVHEAEQVFLDGKKSGKFDLLYYTQIVENSKNALLEYQGIYERKIKNILRFSSVAWENKKLTLHELVDSLRLMVTRTAREQKKEVPRIHVSGGKILVQGETEECINIFLLHVIGNAIVHGIEAPEERLNRGKTSFGNIYIHAEAGESGMYLEFMDDGRGLDLDKIRMLNRQVDATDSESIPDSELAETIFYLGVSTSDEVSESSGRGIGLSAVRSALEKLQGRIRVRLTTDIKDSGKFIPFRFEVNIPPVKAGKEKFRKHAGST